MLNAIQKTGGTFGVFGATMYLGTKRPFFAALWHWLVAFFNPSHDGMEYIDAMIAQIGFDYSERIGVDHVSLGMDGDGFVGLPFKNYAEMADH